MGLPRRFPLALSVIVLVGTALRLWAVLRTTIDRSGRPLVDDAFYYFALGRNLAGGAGLRIDAEHLTNGFQPIWGLLNALPYWIIPSRPIAGAQLIGVVVAVLTIIALHTLVARLSGSPIAGLYAASLWACSPLTVLYSVNGMDTGLAVLAGLVVLLAIHAIFSDRTLTAVKLGGLACGGAFLARVDLLLLGAAVWLMLLLFPPLPRSRHPAAVFAACCALPVLPWILLSLSMGKSPLPESGAAVQLMATLIEEGGPFTFLQALARELPRFVSRAASNLSVLLAIDPLIFRDSGAEWFTIGAGLAAALWIALWALARTRIERIMVGLWSVYALLTLLGYAGFIGAEWFYDRYGTPLAETFTALAVAIVGARIAQAHRPARRWLIGAAALYGLVTVGMFGLLVKDSAQFDWLRGAPREGDPFVQTSIWLNTFLRPADRVGVFQSGLIGYRAAMPVINLDGKVNADARRAMAQGQMWYYICDARIDYIADWKFVIDRLLVARSADWQPANLQLVHRVSRAESNADWRIYRVTRANCDPPAQGPTRLMRPRRTP